ncbi:MAG: hypothetical protein U9Q66_01680 [Patescibacteria group bacterium]|nr:hypothetical protein [Patescibacteria group bacterium]
MTKFLDQNEIDKLIDLEYFPQNRVKFTWDKLEELCEPYFEREMKIRKGLKEEDFESKQAFKDKIHNKLLDLYKDIAKNIGLQNYNRFIHVRLVAFIRDGLLDGERLLDLVDKLDKKKK